MQHSSTLIKSYTVCLQCGCMTIMISPNHLNQQHCHSYSTNHLQLLPSILLASSSPFDQLVWVRWCLFFCWALSVGGVVIVFLLFGAGGFLWFATLAESWMTCLTLVLFSGHLLAMVDRLQASTNIQSSISCCCWAERFLD